MLEGKQLILATRPYAVDDSKRSWFYTITTLALLIVTFIGAFNNYHPAIRVASSIIHALLLVRMFVINHDYQHKSILNKSPLASIIFKIYSLYVITPSSIWKRSHDYHHTHNSKLFTSSIGSFPIVTKEKFLEMSKGERRTYLFIRHPFTIVFAYLFAFIFGMAILSLIKNPKKHWDSAVSILFHYSILVLVAINFGWLTAFLSIFLPLFISQIIGSYLFYVQHNFPDSTFEEKEGWTYSGAAFNSTSFLKMNKIMHWFTANIGYHHIHHLNARIPFYRLPEVYKAFPEFQNPKTISLHPRDIYRCMQLKVWDPEVGRMVGLKEIYS